MQCHICSSPARAWGQATVLEKYPVQYYQCERCGFIQTEPPYWLDEAYSEAITRSDLGLVTRNVVLARTTQSIVLAFFNQQARYVDYGGGYGMFVRLMRDAGFDYYRLDKYCANLFAAGFDADESGRSRYELLTAFEVFEHLAQPLAEIQKMLSLSRNLLFSTRLAPSPAPDLNTWWYYGLDHGQHVAVYTRQSLGLLARQFGLNFYSDNRTLHLLTEKRLPGALFKLVALTGRWSWGWRVLLTGRLRSKSLLADDYYALTGRRLT